jgi:hypothetical protein
MRELRKEGPRQPLLIQAEAARLRRGGRFSRRDEEGSFSRE